MVRSIKKEKIKEFHKLFSEVLREGFPEYSSGLVEFFINKDFSVENIKKQTESGEITVLVDEEISGLVGFLIYEKLYGGVSYCVWVGVLKEARGQGVGRKLMEEWEKRILIEGGHKLMLLTQSQTNRKIFPKYGFKEEGYEEKSWFGLDAWIFGKVISEPKLKNYLG